MGHNMLPEERLKYIYQIVKEKKRVFVDDLSRALSISKTTVRTDLAELKSRGLVKRTHGGAVLSDVSFGYSQPDFLVDNITVTQRMEQNVQEKEAIGKLAASLIVDGDTMMIDGGSTTPFVAKYLSGKKRLTIITNSIYLMPALLANKDAVVYVTGGLVYHDNAIVVGDYANKFIDQFRVNKTILGIDGLSVEHGLTVADSQEPAVLPVKRKMINACRELIIVCDHTKIGRVCLASVEALSRVSCVVTGEGADMSMIKQMEQMGIRVLVTPY